MFAAEWEQAHRSGKLVHDWTTLELTDSGRRARLRVSADGARVAHPGGERVREGAGAFAVQRIADAMGGIMLTAKLVELRHVQATVVLRPLVASLVKPGGSIRTTTAAEHSRAIDRAIQRAVPFTGYGDHPYQGKAGPWSVSNIGKHMVLDNGCTALRCRNHGWLVHESELRRTNGQLTWLGVPVYACVWLGAGWYLIQRLGGAHGFGPTGADQDDYSQTAIIADGTMWVEGEGDLPTATVYTHPDLCGFVTHDGVPLKWSRHPEVPLAIEGILAAPAAPTAAKWQDASLSYGERVAEWMLAQLAENIREVPMGSNNGPEVGAWLGACVRDGVVGFGPWLQKTGGDWCAAATSAALAFAWISGELAISPFQRRASGLELENDAKARGTWRAASMAASGAWELERGDVVILPRGGAGSWKRHVCVFLRWIDRAKGLIETIGGNEENRFQLTQRHVSDALGYIELPSSRPAVAVTIPAAEVAAMPALLAALSSSDPWDNGNNTLGGNLFAAA